MKGNELKGHETKNIQKITSKRRTSFTSRFVEEAHFIYYPFMNHYSHMTLHVYIYIFASHESNLDEVF